MTWILSKQTVCGSGLRVKYNLSIDEDCTTSSRALARQTKHQSLKLLGIQIRPAILSNVLPWLQLACRQPNDDPVAYLSFHANGATYEA